MATLPQVTQLSRQEESLWRAVALGERAASAVLLTALAPSILGSAVLVYILSGRSPFIAHRRVGWHGSELWMLKLRTMWDSNGTADRKFAWVEYLDDQRGPLKKAAGDARIGGRFASFCRKHSIDELPQLWHVLRGEMALIGPRPITQLELQLHYGPDADEVLTVRPGIAGLWQTSGRNRLSYSERLRMDLEFVRGRSLKLYFNIVRRTLVEIASGSNAC